MVNCQNKYVTWAAPVIGVFAFNAALSAKAQSNAEHQSSTPANPALHAVDSRRNKEILEVISRVRVPFGDWINPALHAVPAPQKALILVANHKA